MQLKISDITIGDRFRQDFGDLQGLRESMQRVGLIEPIVVEITADGKAALVAGERRLRAAKELGWETIEATKRSDLDEFQRLEIELEENLHRKDLEWTEEVKAKRELHLLKQALHGKSKQGARTDLGKKKEGWGLRDTAESLGQSVGPLSQDIQLAEALLHLPLLAKEKNKNRAFRKLSRLRRRAASILLADQLKKERGELDGVYNKDFFVLAKQLADESFDFVVADPPWGIGIDQSEMFTHGDYHKPVVGDRTSDVFTDEEASALEQIERLLVECYRLLRRDRHMVMFCGEQHYSFLLDIARHIGFTPANVPGIWDKKIPGRPHNKWLSPEHEVFMDLMKGERALTSFHGTMFRHERASGAGRRHPTTKPVELIREIIEVYTLPQEVILDPMMGSGTSVIAAHACGREIVACEIREDYYTDALVWIHAAEEEGAETEGA